METASLTKEFGGVRAIDGISLRVEEGEVFGFLGPNGAGKSTTMMILTTLLKPTSGRALVAGHDVAASPGDVRRSIGYVQQESTADEFLTGRENLALQARMNRMPSGLAASRIDEMLDLIELADKQHEPVLGYSGGMRKRLDIAGGLLHMPRVLFLDEPTVGLDIQTRRRIWEYIGRLHDELGMSVFVSTHYMEEADRLCDEVGIIDYGKIQAIDSPGRLKGALGREAVALELDGDGAAREKLAAALGAADGVEGVSAPPGGGPGVTVFAHDSATAIPRIFGLAERMGVRVSSISISRPTLEDVFVSYTGRELRDAPAREDRGGRWRRRSAAAEAGKTGGPRKRGLLA